MKAESAQAAAQASAPESRLVQVRLFNAACWPVGVTPQ